MSIDKLFDIAGSAMSAQSKRLNTTASNLANANAVAGSAAEAYRARRPVFSTEPMAADGFAAGIKVDGISESTAAPRIVHMPDHPQADADGNVFASNVNVVEEMVDMIAASRSYQNSVEVAQVSKELLLRTLKLGQ